MRSGVDISLHVSEINAKVHLLTCMGSFIRAFMQTDRSRQCWTGQNCVLGQYVFSETSMSWFYIQDSLFTTDGDLINKMEIIMIMMLFQ